LTSAVVHVHIDGVDVTNMEPAFTTNGLTHQVQGLSVQLKDASGVNLINNLLISMLSYSAILTLFSEHGVNMMAKLLLTAMYSELYGQQRRSHMCLRASG
jgi:hypothetical protein